MEDTTDEELKAGISLIRSGISICKDFFMDLIILYDFFFFFWSWSKKLVRPWFSASGILTQVRVPLIEGRVREEKRLC